jgi:hypothetical protein
MCSATTSRRFSAVLRGRGRRLTVIARGAKQSIAPREGRMDCFVRFAPRNDGGWIRLRDLAARGARRFAFRCPSQNSGRRDGRVRAAPAVSCATCTKKTHTSIQVWRRHPTFPAQWLYGLLRAHPGERALLSPSLPDRFESLMPASRHQVHTTSPYATARSSFAAAASTATRPNVCDDGQRPSDGTGCGSSRTDLGESKSGIFSLAGLDQAHA